MRYARVVKGIERAQIGSQCICEFTRDSKEAGERVINWGERGAICGDKSLFNWFRTHKLFPGDDWTQEKRKRLGMDEYQWEPIFSDS